MEGEGEGSLSPKKRAKKELEDAFNAALDRIKVENVTEESASDLQEDVKSIEEPISDLQEEKSTSDLQLVEEEEIKEIKGGESEKIVTELEQLEDVELERSKTELEEIEEAEKLEKTEETELEDIEAKVEDIKEEQEEILAETEKAELCNELMQIRGIGQKTAEKLVELSITSIEELAALEVDMIPETVDLSTKSLRNLIKNAQKHLKKERIEEKTERIEDTIADFQDERSSLVEMISNLKAEFDQFVNSTKDDTKFFYDELAKFFDELSKLKSDVSIFTERMNKIDEKVNTMLIENDYKRDIDIAEAKMIRSNETPSETIPADTLEITSSNAEELASLDQKDDDMVIVVDTSGKLSASAGAVTSTDQVSAEIESESIKQPKTTFYISFDEIVERLKAVGLLRESNESYYIICEILARHDPQEMTYDALFIKSNLNPQIFSQIIFDLATKKIINFDTKTEKVRFQSPK
ncbi:MAG: helix-hairpin-helix domain-containing protein [Promethearchaeota archaeon]